MKADQLASSKSPKNVKLQSDLAASQKRLDFLEKLVIRQQERIERLNKPRVRLPLGKRQDAAGCFARVVIPDTHGSHVQLDAISAMLVDLESIQPRETVWLGDHLECGGFLAQNWTLGYVAECGQTFEEDIAAANTLLDAVQSACRPKAQHYYLEGNHERRIEKWCVTQSLKNRSDAQYLLRCHSARSNLNIDQRGIHYYPQAVFQGGCRIPGTIQLGKCHFTHGSHIGRHAASSHLVEFGGNVVYGHTHRVDSFVARSVNAGEIGAWCPGCLCQLQPYWRHTQLTGWSHGYGIQLVRPNGEFLHINVPIIDGRSLLVPLTESVSRPEKLRTTRRKAA